TRSEALGLAEAAVQAYPRYAPYLDTFGTCLMRMGRVENATAAFRQALGCCEADRTVLAKRASENLSAPEKARVEKLTRRLERTTAEIRVHYDAAMKASGGR